MIVPNSETYTDDSVFASVPVCSIHSSGGADNTLENNELGNTVTPNSGIGNSAGNNSNHTSGSATVGVAPGRNGNNDKLIAPTKSGDTIVEPIN